MRAELLKIRAMPTPRWCGFAVFATMLIGLAATWRWGLGPDRDVYELTVSFPSSIAATVFGVWLFGSEYGEGTMRRALTADPRRGRLFFSKLATGILLVILATVVIYLIAFPFYDLAADRHGQSIALSEYRDVAVSSLVFNLAFLLVGAACALIAASMAGGITLAFTFIFILSLGLAAVPEIQRYTFLVGLGDLDTAIRGPDGASLDQENSTATAAVITAVWLGGLLLLGWLRLWRSDVK